MHNNTATSNEAFAGASTRKKSQKPWRGITRGHWLELVITSSISIFPMLVLSIVLLCLVFTNLVPNNGSSYVEDTKQDTLLDSSDYHIDYSATRLVFISSIASTLAPLLLSAAMTVLSYPVAYFLAVKSDEGRAKELSTPFQLDIMIKILDAKILSLWSILLYVLDRTHCKAPMTHDLRNAVAAFVALATIM